MKSKSQKHSISRRKFINTSTAALTGLAIVPSHVVSGLGHTPPSDKLNVAGIGIGGMGRVNLNEIAETENIVALCDVDWSETVGEVFKTYPKAKRYKDYRVMLDTQEDIDAVVISTPDHTHAVISMEAIRRGKHVYTEKPLTYTLHEARELTKAAKESNVATQMGNHGQAEDATRRLREMIWDEVIGTIHHVHVWTDRPIWPQGITRPSYSEPVPSSLDWDLFIGPVPMQLYHSSYHPFNWRGWWDFGTGALGDIGCHSFDPVFRALKLKYPVSVQAVSTQVNADTFPLGSIVEYDFPAREGMPPVKLTWYDGGLRPTRIPGIEDGVRIGNGGVMYVGSNGMILNGEILPESLKNSYEPPEPYLPSSPGHRMEWILACKGGDPAGSNFDWAGPLTETVLLGNIALRPELRAELGTQVLKFNPETLSFPNLPEADQFAHYEYRDGWKL
ncbi:MAG: Gfo/Idh/MocA family oxidoreductase [Balneolaceae bacterium]|nr:Gfo/Idh/MocA family oxidoreductase [Balneolaceae bacterium]